MQHIVVIYIIYICCYTLLFCLLLLLFATFLSSLSFLLICYVVFLFLLFVLLVCSFPHWPKQVIQTCTVTTCRKYLRSIGPKIWYDAIGPIGVQSWGRCFLALQSSRHLRSFLHTAKEFNWAQDWSLFKLLKQMKKKNKETITENEDRWKAPKIEATKTNPKRLRHIRGQKRRLPPPTKRFLDLALADRSSEI